MTEVLKKDSFSWEDTERIAFETLKTAMTKAPALALPNFTKQFIIKTDALSTGMGAVHSKGSPHFVFGKKGCPKLNIHRVMCVNCMP